jgi:transcriptional regulator with XRE-family HTH domain
MTVKMTDMPLMLPDVDEDGHTALWRWRDMRGYSHQQVANYLGVSTATYYRYEAGMNLSMRKANVIVKLTRGAVRYRDLIADFNPEYA